MNTSNRSVVSRIAQITANVEWLFDAQSVVLQHVPCLLRLLNDFAKADRYDTLFEVKLVPIVVKESEQQFTQTSSVCLAEILVFTEVLVECHIHTVKQVWLEATCTLKGRQYRWAACLQEVQNQTDPGVGAQSSSKCCSPTLDC